MKDKNKRLTPSIKEGLTKQEVNTQKQAGRINTLYEDNGKSTSDIIKSNVFTLFNIINIILAIAIICVGSFKNLTFMGIIILNTCISIIQELRSKKALDKLKILSNKKAKVIRDKKEEWIELGEIVLDDIIIYKMGDQVVVDSIMKEGEVLVNESFITGEAENILKREGDMLLSGSFIVSGKATCQVEHIGLDNYTAKISSGTSLF